MWERWTAYMAVLKNGKIYRLTKLKPICHALNITSHHRQHHHKDGMLMVVWNIQIAIRWITSSWLHELCFHYWLTAHKTFHQHAGAGAGARALRVPLQNFQIICIHLQTPQSTVYVQQQINWKENENNNNYHPYDPFVSRF